MKKVTSLWIKCVCVFSFLFLKSQYFFLTGQHLAAIIGQKVQGGDITVDFEKKITILYMVYGILIRGERVLQILPFPNLVCNLEGGSDNM